MFQDFFKHYSMFPENHIGFNLFSAYHVTWLVSIALFTAAAAYCYRRATPGIRRIVLLILGSSMMILELLKDGILLVIGKFGLEYLPLHLCSFGIFISFFYALYPSKRKGELLYGLSLPGALAALIFCNWTVYPPFNFMHLHSFIIHGMLVMFPVLLLASGELVPNVKYIKDALFFLLAVSIPVYFFNKWAGTNFLFLNTPSKGSPLVLFEELLGNPGYVLGFVPLLFLVWSVLYLPFYFKERYERKRNITL